MITKIIGRILMTRKPTMSKKHKKALSKKDKAFVKKMMKNTIEHAGLFHCNEKLEGSLQIVINTLKQINRL